MIKIIQLNICKAIGKTTDLINYVNNHSINILALQEPHVDNNNLDIFNSNCYDLI